MSDETALEVAILNPKDLSQALRLGLLRPDRRGGRGLARRSLRMGQPLPDSPCLGPRPHPCNPRRRTIRLHKHAEIRFKPIAFYALAPAADFKQSSPAALGATS